MKVLYITGACLTRNTSANMSHNSYIQGLLENGVDLEIVMANDSWGEQDTFLQRWDSAIYHVYNSISFKERLRKFVHRTVLDKSGSSVTVNNDAECKNEQVEIKQMSIREICKRIFNVLLPSDELYPLEHTWLKNAKKFKSNCEYDLVVSNSSPAASHKLAYELIKNKHIKTKRWVQIWEDPWCYDLYGSKNDNIKNEEHHLLQVASEVYYVSPLTLMYQKKYFADCADKMKCIALPYFNIDSNDNMEIEDFSFGYFGDYYSKTRNLKPFYEAATQLNMKTYIYGDSDLNLESTDDITVSGRVTLDKLEKIQNKTNVLVHLCNLKGGQIPGKIYHYSATNKPILFILDGTDEEQKQLKDYFGKFNRYYFCKNTKESISNAIDLMKKEYKYKEYEKVISFSPKEVVSMVLEGTEIQNEC